VNRQLLRLSVASMVLLAALVVATTYWQTWAVAGLRDRQDNAIQQVAQLSIARGLIVSPNHTVFARNERRRLKGQTLFSRRYPQHGLAAQVVGYSTDGGTRAGLEAKRGSLASAAFPSTCSQKRANSRSFWMLRNTVLPSPAWNGP